MFLVFEKLKVNFVVVVVTPNVCRFLDSQVNACNSILWMLLTQMTIHLLVRIHHCWFIEITTSIVRGQRTSTSNRAILQLLVTVFTLLVVSFVRFSLLRFLIQCLVVWFLRVELILFFKEEKIQWNNFTMQKERRRVLPISMLIAIAIYYSTSNFSQFLWWVFDRLIIYNSVDLINHRNQIAKTGSYPCIFNWITW